MLDKLWRKNFMNAWRAACDHPGKARLLVPAGVFALSAIVFGGPCKGISPIVVQITGILKAVPDISMYPSPEWLLFESINGLVILGGGAVDGQGAIMWAMNDCEKNQNCARLPASIILNKVTNASVRRITSIDPMGFHFFVSLSKNVRMFRLHIKAPATSPNTDGIHISTSDWVRVARSRIETGDDCIGILQGSTRIAINRVTCGPGHGISIGSLGNRPNERDVSGIQVKNCTLRGTENGLRIKTWPFKPNVIPIQASGFLFQDVILDNVKNPIVIDQQYCGGGKGCKMQPSRVRLSNIYFNNIVGTSTTPQAISVKCSTAVPCQNVHFININLKSAQGVPTTAACTSARLNLQGIQIPLTKCY
ncbi:hypothetical protein Nepgr_020618 [Nepenthes gracilis]|uniref:Uncharacterized protein n=1 Tax=Nepenthes gracilis TaxID=150966 RepID=A0AAD3XV80_NEPGR|nr:hypothetical protein Nepgr_020618 [Nepenthes gracilis]